MTAPTDHNNDRKYTKCLWTAMLMIPKLLRVEAQSLAVFSVSDYRYEKRLEKVKRVREFCW